MNLIPISNFYLFGFFVAFFLDAIRKLDYELYRFFPHSGVIHIFLWKRDFKYYWSNRADLGIRQVLVLYPLWMLARVDKYLPIIDCDRQAAKAQYFHDKGRYHGMRGFAFRYINPKAWPVFFLRHFYSFLVTFFSSPSNQVIQKFKNHAAAKQSKDELTHA
jgi:hypothetical protein